MDLVMEPDLYSPSINDKGEYIDCIPSFHHIKKGLKCPCGSRKDKVYETKAIFTSHTKTKSHQDWLTLLNLNRSNFFTENEKLKGTVHTQRLIIAQLEKEIQSKSMTIGYLTHQLNKESATHTITQNLLDLDL